MTQTRKHRILLVNFAEYEADRVRKQGFNIDIGYVGKYHSVGDHPFLDCYSPHPFYDYDVYVFNSQVPYAEFQRSFPTLKNIAQDTLATEPLLYLDRPPHIRIAFTGGSAGYAEHLRMAGIAPVKLVQAQENVSSFEIVPERTFSIKKLHETITRLRGDISTPIGHYIGFTGKECWPLVHFPVLVNRNRDLVAAYGAIVIEGESKPVYIVLPQLKDNVKGLIEILNTLVAVRPDIFPDIQRQAWLDGPDFALPEEREIDSDIKAKIEGLNKFVEVKRGEKEEVNRKFGFIKQILVATESDSLPREQRLSTNVKQALEFLGFEVEDIDSKIKSAIKKEDFWVRDGDFLAITEVTGTVSKNPKSKEYNDLLGRMNTIFKRSDLVPNKDKANISGLLVINHDIETHPNRRPGLYTGELEHIVEAAKESSIGILATVDLHRVAVAVKDGTLPKDQARNIVKNFGRIVFKPGRQSNDN